MVLTDLGAQRLIETLRYLEKPYCPEVHHGFGV